MNLGKITMGNMKDVASAIRQGKKVCIVYDKESSSIARNFVLYPSEEEKDVIELIGENIFLEFTDEMYYTALELYAHYDAKDGVIPSACLIIKEDTQKPYLAFCSQDVLKHPVKYMALLQINFDYIFLV